MILLGFDTSGPHCAAALWCDGQVIAERIAPMSKGQAERLMPMLSDMMAETGTAWMALTAVAAGTGPGNFTGTRIAVAAARSLALACDCPAIGVSGFDAWAGGRTDCAIALPARRDTYHLQWPGGAVDTLTLDQVAARIGDTPLCGALQTGDDGVMPHEAPFPIASLARTAASRLDQPITPPAPVYLRPPEAALPADPPPRIIP